MEEEQQIRQPVDASTAGPLDFICDGWCMDCDGGCAPDEET